MLNTSYIVLAGGTTIAFIWIILAAVYLTFATFFVTDKETGFCVGFLLAGAVGILYFTCGVNM